MNEKFLSILIVSILVIGGSVGVMASNICKLPSKKYDVLKTYISKGETQGDERLSALNTEIGTSNHEAAIIEQGRSRADDEVTKGEITYTKKIILRLEQGDDFTYTIDIPRPTKMYAAGNLIQEIEEMSYNPNPTSIESKYDGDWLYWTGGLDTNPATPEPDEIEIEITYKVSTRSYEWHIQSVDSGMISDIPQNLKDMYNHDEWELEEDRDSDGKNDVMIEPTDSEIKEKAQELTQYSNNVYDCIQKIHNYVSSTIKYTQGNNGLPRHSLMTLRDQEGDCDEKAFLFSSLCRAIGIPAWCQDGTLYDPGTGTFKTGGHTWVTICLPLSDGGYVISDIEQTWDTFKLWRDCYRFTKWATDGNGDHLEDYYNRCGYSFSGAIPPTISYTTEESGTFIDLSPSKESFDERFKSRALYVWGKSNDIIDNSNEADALLQFAKSHDIGTLLFYVDLYKLENEQSKFESFISKVHNNGMFIHALLGQSEWTASSSHNEALAAVDTVLNYNDGSTKKFDGLHLDVEPHTYYLWENDGDSSKNLEESSTNRDLAAQYLSLLVEIKKKIEDANIIFGVDIAFWFDDDDFEIEYTHNGDYKLLSSHVQDIADFITIMDYTDNKNNAYNFAKDEVSYASLVNKYVTVAFETQEMDASGTTFYEEGTDALEQAITYVSSQFSSSDSFGGFAIHYYGSYKEMFKGGSAFDPLKDGFSFNNPGWTTACDELSFEEVKSIILNDPLKSLSMGPLMTMLYFYIYLKVKEIHGNGHCYGMCALALNYYNNHLPTPGNELPFVLDYDEVDEDIEYYHNKQVIDLSTFAILISWGKPYSNINNDNQWDLIKRSLENDQPLIIGLDSNNGKHAVIGYDLDENGDVLIYDPSDPATESDPINVIDVTEQTTRTDIHYEWDNGIVWNSWVALSYEQASVVESFFDNLGNILWIKADCPVELHVYDEKGIELGETLSDGVTHLVLVNEPSNGYYRIELIGTGNGQYDLSVARGKDNGLIFENISGDISDGEINEYSVST